MTKKVIFRCENCGSIKEFEIEEGEQVKIPICCGDPMTNITPEVPPCETSGTSEHGRLDNEDEPCKEQE